MSLVRRPLRWSWIALVVAVPGIASAVPGEGRVVWDPNPPAEGVVAYRVFSGPVSRHDPRFSGYTDVLEVGNSLGVDIGLLGCGAGACYVAVTARNASGLESDYSSEVAVPASGEDTASGGGGGCFLGSL